jgi:hypothetical protein
MPPARHQEFIAKLQQTMGLPNLATAAGLTAVKTLLPLLPAAAMKELGVRRLLQRPGDIILTCPVSSLCFGGVGFWVEGVDLDSFRVRVLLPLLHAEVMKELGVRRLLQKPGDIILMCPVSFISIGYFLDGSGVGCRGVVAQGK